MVRRTGFELVDYLKGKGWIFETRSQSAAEDAALPGPMPGSYVEFLSSFSTLSNGSDDVWFLSLEDYLGRSQSAFSWNEFKTMSLDVADSEEAAARIEEFWNRYIPIAMMTGGHYAYLGIDTVSGAVVHGEEPEFEQVSTVSDCIDDFFGKVLSGESIHGFFED